MLSGDFFIAQPQKKVDWYLFKYFLDIKVGFSWMGDALRVPTMAHFDHFKGQNTHFARIRTVFYFLVIFLYPNRSKKLTGTYLNTF